MIPDGYRQSIMAHWVCSGILFTNAAVSICGITYSTMKLAPFSFALKEHNQATIDLSIVR